ncbi:MAG: ammonia-forming cytochrome c nitrite reductase subunit c552 [Deferribacteraceae bacterium]|nr:ammonia-forming cytochrome c nitrite reductase subunit c552 [Deferribacteraceae bacterium]
MQLSASTGKAKGTPLKKPEKGKAVQVESCFSGCHEPVEMLYGRGAHSKVNCGMCHEKVTAEHIEAPSAENRPVVRFDHRSCAQCHEKELADMLDTKYHMSWAEKNRTPTYGMIRDSYTGIIEDVQYAFPRFHIGILADIAVNRSGGRFKYKDPDFVGKPIESLWDAVYDSRPEDGNVIKPTEVPPLAWRPHKTIGNVSVSYCLKCKSSDNMLEFAYTGKPGKGASLQRDSLSLPTLKTLNTSFNCNYCHDPHSAEPRIVNDFLIETMTNPEFKDSAYQKNVGKDGMTRIEVVEMGERGYIRKIGILEHYNSNFMCGQCHLAGNRSSTFLDRDTNQGISGIKAFDEMVYYVVPFVAGGPIEAYEYYKRKNWYSRIYPATGTKWVAFDHAHMEIVTQSLHGKAGVGCTDCHFAQVVAKESKRMEHQPSLPKEKIQYTCLRSDCHGKGTKSNWQTPAEALYRIKSIQQQSRVRAGHLHAATGEVIAYVKDVNNGVISIGKKELDALHEAIAKSLTLEAYWFTEYSMGFHDQALYESSVTRITQDLNTALANAKKSEKRPLNNK